MASAAGRDGQQASLKRAATAILPSRIGRGLGDDGDEEEKQPLLGRRTSAPAIIGRAERHRAALDRQLSRKLSWMVSVETVYDEDDHNDEKEEASKAGVAREAKADVSEAVNPPDAGQLVLPSNYTEIPDYGPEVGLFRTLPYHGAPWPIICADVGIVVTVAVIALVAQPLLQQKWMSNWSFVLWSRGVFCCVCAALLLSVNAFTFLNPGYQKRFEQPEGLDSKALSIFRKAMIKAQNPTTGCKSWCGKCQAPKPVRAHHCSCCSRCVMGMDHHCGVLMNCVGERNHRVFMITLVLSMFTGLYVLLVLAATFISHWPGIWHLRPVAAAAGLDFDTASWVLLFLFAFSFLMFLNALKYFLMFHSKLIANDYTTIENLEREEGARSRFDRGGATTNCVAFWSGDRMNLEVIAKPNPKDAEWASMSAQERARYFEMDYREAMETGFWDQMEEEWETIVWAQWRRKARDAEWAALSLEERTAYLDIDFSQEIQSRFCEQIRNARRS